MKTNYLMQLLIDWVSWSINYLIIEGKKSLISENNRKNCKNWNIIFFAVNLNDYQSRWCIDRHIKSNYLRGYILFYFDFRAFTIDRSTFLSCKTPIYKRTLPQIHLDFVIFKKNLTLKKHCNPFHKVKWSILHLNCKEW